MDLAEAIASATRDDVIAFTEGLPDDVDLGHQGKVCTICPVARYLSEKTGLPISVGVSNAGLGDEPPGVLGYRLSQPLLDLVRLHMRLMSGKPGQIRIRPVRKKGFLDAVRKETAA